MWVASLVLQRTKCPLFWGLGGSHLSSEGWRYFFFSVLLEPDCLAFDPSVGWQSHLCFSESCGSTSLSSIRLKFNPSIFSRALLPPLFLPLLGCRIFTLIFWELGSPTFLFQWLGDFTFAFSENCSYPHCFLENGVSPVFFPKAVSLPLFIWFGGPPFHYPMGWGSPLYCLKG